MHSSIKRPFSESQSRTRHSSEKTVNNHWVKRDEKTLSEWLKEIPETHQVYAVLSGVCATKPIEHYQSTQVSPDLFPLYRREPYQTWFDVMPQLAVIERDSAFLDWCAKQPSREWGWLFSTPEPASTLVDYFSGLTQVKTQDGKAVFFRYWDGHFFNIICKIIGDEMTSWLPVVSRYWVNGISYTTKAPRMTPPQESPWWVLPKGLLEAIKQVDPEPVIANLIKFVKEEKAHIYFAFPKPVIEAKVRRFYERWQTSERGSQKNDRALLSALCRSLSEDLKL